MDQGLEIVSQRRLELCPLEFRQDEGETAALFDIEHAE